MKTGIIEEIKEKISCREYMLREHGEQVTAGRCKSFRPDAKNKSSLLCNERDWYDFGSGKGGDIIDLAAWDKFNGDKGQAIYYLSEKWGLKSVTPEMEKTFKSYLKIIDLATEFYQSQLKPEHFEYLRSRGLTDGTIKALRLGWSENPCDFLKEKSFTMEQISDSGVLNFVNRLIIPYLRNGKSNYLIGRASVWEEFQSSNPEAKYIKLFRNNMSEHPIWGFDTLNRPGNVIIAEGIFDAIACWQEGFPVVTAVTGAFSGEQKKDLYPALQGRSVIICMDYDPETQAGQKFTENLANELWERGIDTSVVLLSGEESKVDLSELYAKDSRRETLSKIFQEAHPWQKIKIEQMASIGSEKERCAAVEAFLRHCAKILDNPTLQQLCADIKATEAFPEAWLNALVKSLDKCPSEPQIIEEFKKSNDCLFHESLGWYEYNTSRWEEISEYDIQKKVGDIYGKFRTSRNVSAVAKLLRPELLYNDFWNKHTNLINFPNGMLDLESGKLLPHSRDYYSSIQMLFPYTPDARCPNWNTFIEDVTAGDLSRHNLLQEMFGYCLLRDARFQKAFCLLGDGANGKSVLLNVLESMVGSRNCSHVEIAFLQSDFQRIKLLHSMVNICNDMKTDVSGTESFFKAIVAGDPISGCYKGQDFVDFKPFCKMVFSANRMLTAKDVDYSFVRRFCFIQFPVKFVDEPQKPNERKRDYEMTSKLMAELPGILNWSLAGLKKLLEQNSFTETCDQIQNTNELMIMSNPLISFVDEVVGNGAPHWQKQVTKKEVYEKYSEWCRQTNTLPMSARSFWPRLKAIYPYQETRTADCRLVKFIEPNKQF